MIAIGAIVYVRYVPLDTDFHHDGIQFASGIAILDGLRIHSDAFTPYGPLTNWIQALLLAMFGRTVIVLRWQTALSLVVSGALLYCIMRTYKVGPVAAASVSSLWLVTCPSWSQRDGVFAFWSLPSALLLVFLLGGFLLFRLSETTYRDSAKALLLFISDATLALAVFIRINYTLPMLLGFFLYIFFRRHHQTSSQFSGKRFFLTGIAVGLSVPLVFLVITGSLIAHVNQTLTGPVYFYSDQDPNWTYLILLYFFGSIPFLSIATLTLLAAHKTSRPMQWLVSVAGGLVMLLLALVGIGTRVRSGFLGMFADSGVTSWQVVWANAQTIAPLYAAAAVSAPLAVYGLARLIRGTGGAENLLYILSLAAMVQVYPLFDQYHLWWAAPIPLAAGTVLIVKNTRRSVATVAIVAVSFPFALVNLYEWNRIASRERETAEGISLSGMQVYPGIANQLRELDELLQELPIRQTRFHCINSLLSVWQGKYVASTAAHNSWAFGGGRFDDNGFIPTDESDLRFELPPIEFTRTSDSVHIVCSAVPPGPEFDHWLEETGLSLVDLTGPVKPRYDPGYWVYQLM